MTYETTRQHFNEITVNGVTTKYTTKDSGKRAEFDNGFVRDTAEGKPDFGLLLLAGVPYEEQPLTQEAALMSRGAEKYSARNWEQAFSDVPAESPELERAKSSLLRHAIQLCCGETDEDHAAAVAFNARFVKMLRRRAVEGIKVSTERCGGTDGTTGKQCWDYHWHDGFCDSDAVCG